MKTYISVFFNKSWVIHLSAFQMNVLLRAPPISDLPLETGMYVRFLVSVFFCT